MVTPTRIARALGVLGVIGFMALATTSSIATSDLQDDPLAPGLPVAPAGALPDGPIPGPAPEPKPLDAPALPDAAPAPTEPEPLKELPPAPDEPSLKIESTPTPAPAPAAIEEPEANPLPPARELQPSAPKAAPTPPAVDDRPAREPAPRPRASADDPDARARSFVERNRKEADEQLKALRDEAAQLKARLARVEAGIRRWEALSDALGRTEDRAAVRMPGDGLQVRGGVQYLVPGQPSPVIIESQPMIRSDFVPAPLPR